MPKGFCVDPSLKEEVLDKVKNSGLPVAEIARNFGLKPALVYNWLTAAVPKDNPTLEINRLRRQNDELIKLLGELTYDLKKKKSA